MLMGFSRHSDRSRRHSARPPGFARELGLHNSDKQQRMGEGGGTCKANMFGRRQVYIYDGSGTISSATLLLPSHLRNYQLKLNRLFFSSFTMQYPRSQVQGWKQLETPPTTCVYRGGLHLPCKGYPDHKY